MLRTILEFIVMINPFALFVYLTPVMQDLSHRDFVKVFTKATIISFLIYSVFMIIGDVLFQNVFNIQFESFKIFGGIVIFSYAYIYIVKGQKALIHIKENLDDLASEIALPFMVGAGSISLSILMSEKYSIPVSLGLLLFIMTVNFLIMMFLKFIKDQISKKQLKVAFDKNMGILMRLSGFFVGAIGIDLIIQGINKLYLK